MLRGGECIDVMKRSDERAEIVSCVRRSRRRFVQSVGVVGIALTSSTIITTAGGSEETDDGALASVGSDDQGDATEIDSCTVIDEPGEYELISDIGPGSGDHDACIVIESEGVTLRGNGHTIDGSGLDSCIAVTHGSPGSEIELDPVVEDVVVRGAAAGVSSEFSGYDGEYTTIRAIENGRGFDFFIAGGTLTNCVATDNDDGIYLEGDEAWGDGGRVTIQNCTVHSNAERGLRVGRMSAATVAETRIVANDVGVEGHATQQGVTLENCHICRNERAGVDAASSPASDDPEEPEPAFPGRVTAVENYWGASSGPSSLGDPGEPYEDPETGRPANGDGDAISEGIEPGVSNVHFDPFLKSTLDDIGARH